MSTKVWPLVTKEERSVAHYSKVRCYYCDAEVGKPHDHECVTVTRRAELHASIIFTGHRDSPHEPKIISLLWTHPVPYYWDKDLIEFDANERCSYDLLEYWAEIEVLSAPDFPDVKAHLEFVSDSSGGKDPDCGNLKVEFLRFVEDIHPINQPFVDASGDIQSGPV